MKHVKEIIMNMIYELRAFKAFINHIRSLIQDYKTFNGWSPPDKFPIVGDDGPSCVCDKNSITKFVKIEADGTWVFNCEQCKQDRRW